MYDVIQKIQTNLRRQTLKRSNKTISPLMMQKPKIYFTSDAVIFKMRILKTKAKNTTKNLKNLRFPK